MEVSSAGRDMKEAPSHTTNRDTTLNLPCQGLAMPVPKSMPSRAQPMATTPGGALAVLAGRECRAIDRALANTRNRHAGIHRARKGIRSLRAILALGEPKPDNATRRIDRRLRKLARGLSALRDAFVAMQTAQSLAVGGSAAPWHAPAVALEDACNQALRSALATDPDFAARRSELGRIRQALSALPWERVSPQAMARALKHSQRRTKRSEDDARRRSTVDLLHRWRRRLRRLRLQLDAMAKVSAMSPDVVDPAHPRRHMRELKRMTDALGRQQDLRLLRRHLARLDADHRSPAQLRLELRNATADAARATAELAG